MCAALAQLLVLAALPALTGRWCAGGEVVSVTERAAPGATGVSFAPHQRTGVVAAAGQAATLECRVLRLGDKSVSWVRSSDLQILSHAGAVFTADARVSATSARGGVGGVGGSRHSLHIERLRLADAGRYECQVNTEPKMSLFFNLTVLDSPMPEPVVSALGPRHVSAALGGVARLACEAHYEPPPGDLPLPSLDIRWWRDGQLLDLQSARGGVSLDTERWRARAVSHITLADVRARDSGQYTCSAGPARAVLLLHVGDDAPEGAEMQRDETAAAHAGGPERARPGPGAALALLLALWVRATC
ncbi:hypothetical protein O3G_MSEX009535 [Manduca sexta]|uniref:Ig-like domain-containing protein n=1 Tax=Manduca sexta TaxID=7130 RepID=A0A921ZEI4_MANSE|nr:hypothetical protein O3G_MSEX009535 [Manduca sexta]